MLRLRKFRGSGEGEKAFGNEMQKLKKLSHRHLVNKAKPNFSATAFLPVRSVVQPTRHAGFPRVISTETIGESKRGYGNGTLHPLSLDRDLFEDIMKAFKLPNRVKEVICSVHGVFSRFVEYDRGAPRSLSILFSTPKSPVREIVCAIRIDRELASVTCLLLDDRLDDLHRTIGAVNSSMAGLAWRDPVAFLAILLKESGSSSELQRKCLDDDILDAEIKTSSTQWRTNTNNTPNDFYEATNKLNLCHNNLVSFALFQVTNPGAINNASLIAASNC
ncbi:uncharacterized protein NECHADRAFT_82594 [Fusarium vanettenii 77-13-4]|uniref:Uncharacterized protein n=1 Tax=Fusarium vanettenii (strain ATCC MYA-4622 / CBS 123669 / FGSC 9596 / NRRL 45880 / 77-13-4) TaxID=660122 RepID=C7YXN7_FUSV7|nr:uncharacterized protein NECHADRAFT_82594 [Fusarium vanettenii 77-13-4]EEU43373.1 predicted protein [Fusarium vanettenii 77-13-4]